MSEPLQDRVVAAVGEHYDIDCEIGRGAMAVVYRARDRRLKREVAIKVLPPELAYDPAIRMRFTREAETAAHLAHPHIVPIYDVGERGGIAYFVMALVTGGTLGALLAAEPRQQLEEARRLLAEIADALAYAHARGVIHRDIKPDNILLDGDTGRVMVTDFGIARAIEAGTRLTVTGNSVGTPTYMSPEQATGEREVDGRSDIYSLGVLGYQMLTGRVPFTAGNSMALLLKHVSERPRPIEELRPETPRPLREALDRALMKSPDDRWPTASAMRDAIVGEGPRTAAWRSERETRTGQRTGAPENRQAGAARAVAGQEPGKLPAGGEAHGIVLEPAHLAGLTPAQREDLRLWHGRVHLIDRIKAARGYAWITLATIVVGIPMSIAGLAEGIPPAVLGPIVPIYMSRKLWRRGRSLREAGLKLRRVFLMPRAKSVLPAPPAPPKKAQLAKLAPREILESPVGAGIRRAAEDRAAILDIFRKLPKAERAQLRDVEPTADALVERVSHLAQMLHRLDESIDPRLLPELEARIAEVEREPGTPEGERRMGLLRRQRESLAELMEQRALLARQFDSAGLALGNLRLDLIKYRSSGLQSALSDLASATREARALSRDIGVALEAADEVRNL